ncbi:MAG: TVP38/TMEM64 family protein [Candidatus Omnitrophica bacterium]|nr:TVP38/TMEM64 family protein [Candidatus Omnitrophota bacterium]
MSKLIKVLLALALIALAIAANHYGVLQKILAGMNALGPWAAPAFVVVYALTAVLLIPSFVFTFGGGTLFGFWGIPLALLGTGLGSAIAFLIGRTFAREFVAKKFENHKTFKALDAAVQKKGWQIITLARLSPIFPFSVGNYAFGLTALPLPAYALSSMLGTIPSASVYTYLGMVSGTLASDSSRTRSPLEWLLLLGGLIATVFLVRFIQSLAKSALAETIKPQE